MPLAAFLSCGYFVLFIGKQQRNRLKFVIFMCKIAYFYKLIVRSTIISIIHLSFFRCGTALLFCKCTERVNVHRLGKFTMTLNYHNNHKTNRLAVPIYPFYEASERPYKRAHTRLFVRPLLRATRTFAIVNCTSVTKPIIFHSVFNSIYVFTLHSLSTSLARSHSLSFTHFRLVFIYLNAFAHLYLHTWMQIFTNRENESLSHSVGKMLSRDAHTQII